MKSSWVLGAVAALALPAAAAAQGGVAPATARPLAPTMAQGGGVRSLVAAVETKTTTGRPYSAEAVNESVQVLADGNRIQRQSVTKVYRDSEGRTRREMFAADGSLRSVSISDPVAHVSYTLDPQAKIARKTGGNVVAPATQPPSTYTFARSGGEQTVGTVIGRGGGSGAGSGSGAGFGSGSVTSTATVSGGGRGGRGATPARVPAKEDPNVTTEDLGPQNIEGVSATGTRTTTTIPSGEIGNAQAIRIVSERWFSEELQVLVLTKHSDPRSGDAIYRLRNILRAEPDPSLFTVPADYKIEERRVRRPQ